MLDLHVIRREDEGKKRICVGTTFPVVAHGFDVFGSHHFPFGAFSRRIAAQISRKAKAEGRRVREVGLSVVLSGCQVQLLQHWSDACDAPSKASVRWHRHPNFFLFGAFSPCVSLVEHHQRHLLRLNLPLARKRKRVRLQSRMPLMCLSLSRFMSTKINEVINFNDLGERKRPGTQTFNAEHNRK